LQSFASDDLLVIGKRNCNCEALTHPSVLVVNKYSVIVFAVASTVKDWGNYLDSVALSLSSGEVPGLSALFSACTSTDAYSVVSVGDFLCLFIWN